MGLAGESELWWVVCARDGAWPPACTGKASPVPPPALLGYRPQAEREIRYYDGQDYCSRKLKGAIDLTQFSAVRQATIEGGAGLNIDTPGRVWELLPETATSAAEWFKMLNSLLQRTRGVAVVSSLSNLALEEELQAEQEENGIPKAKKGQLTVVLKRQLGMSICKMGQDIVVAKMEPDGAAAACGLLASGDAVQDGHADQAPKVGVGAAHGIKSPEPRTPCLDRAAHRKP